MEVVAGERICSNEVQWNLSNLVSCPDHTPKGKGLVASPHFLGLINIQFEKSHYQSQSQKRFTYFYVGGSAKFLSNFTYSPKIFGVWSGNKTIVLCTIITSVGCEISFLSFLILRTVPKNVAKATRPFLFGVWSGHETTLIWTPLRQKEVP